MSELTVLFVDVKGDPYVEADDHILGVYALEVDLSRGQGQAACAALDEFHRRVGIEEVDAFEIGVFDADGRQWLDDEQPCEVKAVFLGRVERLPVEPPTFTKDTGNAGP